MKQDVRSEFPYAIKNRDVALESIGSYFEKPRNFKGKKLHLKELCDSLDVSSLVFEDKKGKEYEVHIHLSEIVHTIENTSKSVKFKAQLNANQIIHLAFDKLDKVMESQRKDTSKEYIKSLIRKYV